MIYVYNPAKSPQYYGASVVVRPGYSAIEEDIADAMIASGVEIIKEDDPRFVFPWKQYPGQSPDTNKPR